jgi:hypothetical protein
MQCAALYRHPQALCMCAIAASHTYTCTLQLNNGTLCAILYAVKCDHVGEVAQLMFSTANKCSAVMHPYILALCMCAIASSHTYTCTQQLNNSTYCAILYVVKCDHVGEVAQLMSRAATEQCAVMYLHSLAL